MDHAENSAPAGVEKVTPPVEHTPGPWEAHHGWASSGPYAEHPNWCEVTGGGPPGDKAFISIAGHFGLADARLIAAAPDLLEALEAFVEEVAGTFPFASLPPAKAAIAKARGAPPDT